MKAAPTLLNHDDRSARGSKMGYANPSLINEQHNNAVLDE